MKKIISKITPAANVCFVNNNKRIFAIFQISAPLGSIKMPKDFERKCVICGRNHRNDRMLGPLIHLANISAHFNCVLFSPSTPDSVHYRDGSSGEQIAGLSTRFIRTEAQRAKRLVCFCLCHYILVAYFLSDIFVFLRFHSDMQFLSCKWRKRWLLLWHWYRLSGYVLP